MVPVLPVSRALPSGPPRGAAVAGDDGAGAEVFTAVQPRGGS